ncbi:MAG: HAMP domain-containing sensor histidine kinase [Candidatus Woesearchaeota archaeon]
MTNNIDPSNHTSTAKDSELVEQLRAENKRLTYLKKLNDDIFSLISHDMRAPFQGTLGYLEIMLDDWNDLSREELYKMTSDVKMSVRDSYTQLDQLLTWSRSQRNHLESTPIPLPLYDMMEEVTQQYKPSIQTKQISLLNTIDKQAQVYADEFMLNRVFYNLIGNAIKFTPAGGNITISANYPANPTRIAIADSGVGMDKGIQEKLFTDEHTSRISSKGTAGEQGTGLGLLICKNFIEKNGGTITFESVLNKGTTFYVTVPAYLPSEN